METGIVIEVPAAEQLVGPDSGMPAHVTLLYPFCADPDVGTVEELRFFFAGVDAFTLTFSEVGEFPGRVVYLCPEPADEVSALTAALVRRWPECQPYGGEFDTVVPHLTLAESTDDEVRTAARDAAAAGLPLTSHVTSASLFGRVDGRWQRLETFPLGQP